MSPDRIPTSRQKIDPSRHSPPRRSLALIARPASIEARAYASYRRCHRPRRDDHPPWAVLYARPSCEARTCTHERMRTRPTHRGPFHRGPLYGPPLYRHPRKQASRKPRPLKTRPAKWRPPSALTRPRETSLQRRCHLPKIGPPMCAGTRRPVTALASQACAIRTRAIHPVGEAARQRIRPRSFQVLAVSSGPPLQAAAFALRVRSRAL